MFVVSVNEGFACIAELVFVFEARYAESLLLQQTQHDLNLVEPAVRSRCIVKPDAAFELRQPVIVLLVR